MSKRSLFVAICAGLLAVLGVSPAWAQLGITLKADIPFQFMAGSATLPAGHYTLQPSPAASRPIMSLLGHEPGVGAFLMTNPAHSAVVPDETRLVFHKYGDRYFLAEIWVGGQQGGWRLPPSRSERELSRRAGRFENVPVVARRQR